MQMKRGKLYKVVYSKHR